MFIIFVLSGLPSLSALSCHLQAKRASSVVPHPQRGKPKEVDTAKSGSQRAEAKKKESGMPLHHQCPRVNFLPESVSPERNLKHPSNCVTFAPLQESTGPLYYIYIYIIYIIYILCVFVVLYSINRCACIT